MPRKKSSENPSRGNASVLPSTEFLTERTKTLFNRLKQEQAARLKQEQESARLKEEKEAELARLKAAETETKKKSKNQCKKDTCIPGEGKDKCDKEDRIPCENKIGCKVVPHPGGGEGKLCVPKPPQADVVLPKLPPGISSQPSSPPLKIPTPSKGTLVQIRNNKQPIKDKDDGRCTSLEKNIKKIYDDINIKTYEEKSDDEKIKYGSEIFEQLFSLMVDIGWTDENDPFDKQICGNINDIINNYGLAAIYNFVKTINLFWEKDYITMTTKNDKTEEIETKHMVIINRYGQSDKIGVTSISYVSYVKYYLVIVDKNGILSKHTHDNDTPIKSHNFFLIYLKDRLKESSYKETEVKKQNKIEIFLKEQNVNPPPPPQSKVGLPEPPPQVNNESDEESDEARKKKEYKIVKKEFVNVNPPPPPTPTPPVNIEEPESTDESDDESDESNKQDCLSVEWVNLSCVTGEKSYSVKHKDSTNEAPKAFIYFFEKKKDSNEKQFEVYEQKYKDDVGDTNVKAKYGFFLASDLDKYKYKYDHNEPFIILAEKRKAAKEEAARKEAEAKEAEAKAEAIGAENVNLKDKLNAGEKKIQDLENKLNDDEEQIKVLKTNLTEEQKKEQQDEQKIEDLEEKLNKSLKEKEKTTALSEKVIKDFKKLRERQKMVEKELKQLDIKKEVVEKEFEQLRNLEQKQKDREKEAKRKRMEEFLKDTGKALKEAIESLKENGKFTNMSEIKIDALEEKYDVLRKKIINFLVFKEDELIKAHHANFYSDIIKRNNEKLVETLTLFPSEPFLGIEGLPLVAAFGTTQQEVKENPKEEEKEEKPKEEEKEINLKVVKEKVRKFIQDRAEFIFNHKEHEKLSVKEYLKTL
jgi:hypothetical protein